MHREALLYLKAYFEINVRSFAMRCVQSHTGRYVEIDKSSLNKRRNKNNNRPINRYVGQLMKLGNNR
jgi:hypothetical protein